MSPVTTHATPEVTILRHRGECYVLLWSPENVTAAYQTIGRWAADPELSLSWLQAGFLVQAIADRRKKAKEGEV